MRSKWLAVLSVALMIGMLGGCRAKAKMCEPCPKLGPTGEKLSRTGDEIMVAGQLFHTGAPVVLWTDPGGFDAYRTERRFGPYDKSDYFATTQETKMDPNKVHSPERLSLRSKSLTQKELDMVRGGAWPLELLQQKVDQFVYHFDVTGTSSQCFFI